MSEPTSLEPAARDPSRARLATLELLLAHREADLAAIKNSLQQLQTRYLAEVGALYATLGDLEAQTIDAEIRAGLREAAPDPSETDEADDAAGDAAAGGDPAAGPGTTPAAAPSHDLKAMFRNLAKSIHPDLAIDDAARWRRHSLMAEANRAYAERDEDRLRLILRKWERSPESVLGDGPEADKERLQRRITTIDDHLLTLDAEFADLRASAIWRLKTKIDAARAQGWDLFTEMVQEVKREIQRTTARLATARQAVPNGVPRPSNGRSV